MGVGESQVRKEDEIDLLELAKVIWSKRMFIFKVTGIFVVFGLIVAFTSKVEYEASCKLLPESQEGGPDMSGLGGLAGLAGFDISEVGSSGVLTPELYPEIVRSTPFLDKLINTPVYFENRDTTVTSFLYLKELDNPSMLGFISEYTIGLPGKIKKILSSSSGKKPEAYNLLRYSKEQWKIIQEYKDRLSVSVEDNTGTISISVELPDPVASAMVAEVLVNDLTESVINYKLEKSRVNLSFIKDRFEETKIDYESKQERVAKFTDKNRNISNSIIQTEYQRLQNELNISFEVYKSLASQLEQAKIKVKEQTPVFSVLEPVKIPNDKSKPKRALILIITSFFGFVISLVFILINSNFLR